MRPTLLEREVPLTLKPGRPRQTAARRAADRARNRNLDLHALVMELEHDDPEPDVQAWCALGRPLLRARQRRLELAWRFADDVAA